MADGEKDREHRDPITGAPGAHPIGVGAAAATAGVAGAALGAAVGGPVGAVVGAAVGAVAGGLGGKAAAEAVNPSVETDRSGLPTDASKEP
jgi:outer membrane lipoprotein SlyB